jgi:hypothetical protein
VSLAHTLPSCPGSEREGRGNAGQALEPEEAPPPAVVVDWVNREEEAGLPYDIRLLAPDGSTVLSYIEVKTTRSPQRMYFEVSHREWLFAQREGPRFAIYRVCLAGAAGVSTEGDAALRQGQSTSPMPLRPTVRVIVNPYMQWRAERVGICLAL